MNKLYWIKENLFNIGVLLIAVAAVFVALFLATETLEAMSVLTPFTGGFLLTGFIALFLGFVFTLTFSYFLTDEPETKTDSPKRMRTILIVVSALYLILIGYLVSIDSKWRIQALIIQEIAGMPIEPSYAFYNEFNVSSTVMFYASLIIFGIFVLPLILAETGLLGDSSESQQDYEDQGQAIEQAEEHFDRFVAYLKKRFGSTKKTKKPKRFTNLQKYALPLAAALVLIGCCLIGLPPFVFKDGESTFDPEAGVNYIENYMGVIRGQLLVLGVLLIVVAVWLVIRFRKNKQES